MNTDILRQILEQSNLNNWARICLLSSQIWGDLEFAKWPTVLRNRDRTPEDAVCNLRAVDLKMWVRYKLQTREFNWQIIDIFYMKNRAHNLFDIPFTLLETIRYVYMMIRYCAFHNKLKIFQYLAKKYMINCNHGAEILRLAAQMADMRGNTDILNWIDKEFELNVQNTQILPVMYYCELARYIYGN